MDDSLNPSTPNAKELVSLPAIGLMVAGGARLLLSLTSLAVQVIVMLGISSLSTFTSPSDHGTGFLASLSSGILGIGISMLGLAVNLFLIYGALQMKNLKHYTIALIASIAAVIPCFSLDGGCCCLGCFAGVLALLLGIGAGIWGIIVLMKPEVKAAFEQK
ncbi:MAG: hypothetical protein JST05_07600 [Acidobacteria bacterium]|nr:hypothetical protein [Acidobacteriota bacterium]